MIRNCVFSQQLRSFHKTSLCLLFNSQHPVFKQNAHLPWHLPDLSEEVDNNLRKKESTKEKKVQEYLTLKSLKSKFMKTTEDEAKDLIRQIKNYWSSSWEFPLPISLQSLQKAITFMNKRKITGMSIIAHPWLLNADLKCLDEKILLLMKLEPRDINDFVPLLKLSCIDLHYIEKSFEREKNHIPEGNIIYYFSKRLELEPKIISKHFADHLFIFETEFDQIEEHLSIMLDFKIHPIHIMSDLWALRYDPMKTRPRLEASREAGIENLKPWMIRSGPEVFHQMLALARDRKMVLGEKTVIEYLSQRLEIDDEKMKQLIDRYPAVKRIRVSKMKNVLDFLLIEENFHPSQVVRNPKVLMTSLETMKKRIKELKDHGIQPPSLCYLCFSSNQYQKILDKRIRMNRCGKVSAKI